MPSRYRQRDLRVGSHGTMSIYDTVPPITDPPFVAFGSCNHGIVEDCEDFVGNFTGVNSFIKRTITTHYPRLNGKLYATNGLLAHEFVDFPIADQIIPFDPRDYWGFITGIDLNNFAWSILAGTNPSEPHVSVPTTIGELKDLPSLVKGWGDNILTGALKSNRSISSQLGMSGRKALQQLADQAGHPIRNIANHNLFVRWVLKPMVSDLRKLCDFARAFDNRLREMYALRDGRVLKKRCHLGTSNVVTSSELFHWFHAGYGVLLQGPFQRHLTKEVWGSAQYVVAPDSLLPQLGYDPLRKTARMLSLGITDRETLAVAWQLCPWSWLIDWFSNISDVIAATNNQLGLTWQKICVMRKSKHIGHARIDRAASTPWITLDSDYVIEYECKERYPCFPVLPFPFPTLPIISSGQMSILASLAALRR